jgi:beta-galactosidase
LLAGLDNAALYFSEDDDWQQMAYGLGGAWVQSARVLLEACPADWRRWNYKAEPVKTASLFRSEVENPGPRAAIVVGDVQKGRVILCNLNPNITSDKKLAIIQHLFGNEGIQPAKITARGGFTDFNGRWVQALACGSFGLENIHAAYQKKLPAGEIKPDALFEGKPWKLCRADSEGVFNFRKGLVDGPQENACAYLAVWIKSSKPLDDLLSEPNLPKLSFAYGSDDGCEVWLNGERLASHDRIGPLEPTGFTINPLLLKLGWNQMVIKVVQAGGEWKFAGRFGCSDESFLSQLEFAAAKPAVSK